MKRLLHISLFIAVLLSSFAFVSPAGAAPGERCFEQTGKCISGVIREYWEKNGGLAVFGYPITNVAEEWNNDGWNGPTQWFERDRLEDHTAQNQGVLAGRLGDQYLNWSGKRWQDFPKADANNVATGCRYFAETGHSLCGKFLEYWSKNGGLARFGYPVSEMLNEDYATWSGAVQYFERRRLELHPENAGTQYEVLLGLLGREIQGIYNGNFCYDTITSLQKTANAFGGEFTCAAPFPRVNVPIATEQFERGQMVWVPPVPGDTFSSGTIFVFYRDTSRNALTWMMFTDSWKEGDAVSGGETAPSGLYEPIRGFGKVWRENPSVRNALGWATTQEAGERGHQQYFRGGGWMIYRSGSDRVFLIKTDGTVEDVARIK